MNFMESVTLVNMLPQGFKHSARRLVARQVLHRLMIMAMLLICSAHASADLSNPKDQPGAITRGWRTVNKKGVFGWVLAFILGVSALAIGMSLPDYGAAGGASQFMQTALVAMGAVVMITSFGCAVMSFISLFSQDILEPDESVVATGANTSKFTDNGIDKWRKRIANILACSIFVAVLVLALYSGFYTEVEIDGDEILKNQLLGKSMTFLTLLGMSGFASIVMYANYSKDDVWCQKMAMPVTAMKSFFESKSAKLNGKFGETRSPMKFYLSSKTFWLNMLLILVVLLSFVVGDWTGNSLMMKIGIYTVCTAVFITSIYIGTKRCEVYMSEEGKSHQRWKSEKDVKHIGNKLIFAAFIGIALVSLILGIVGFFPADENGVQYFAGNGSGSIFTVLLLASIGGMGLYKYGYKLKYYQTMSAPEKSSADVPKMVNNDTGRTSMFPGDLGIKDVNSNGSTQEDLKDEESESKPYPVTSAQKSQSPGMFNSDQGNANRLMTTRRRLATLERMVDASL